jgi:hypothetical protein
MTDQLPEGHEELSEDEIEEANGEPLPDREAMSIMTPPHVLGPPDITLPVEPTE